MSRVSVAWADLYDRASDLFDEGQYEQAIETYQRFIEREPSSDLVPGAHAAIAWSRYLLGRYEQSLEAIANVRSKNEEFTGWVKYLEANCHMRLGAYEKAAQAFAEVEEKYPKGLWAEDATLMRGVALLRQGQKEEAVKIFDAFGERYPESGRSDEARYYRLVTELGTRPDLELAVELDRILERHVQDDLGVKIRITHGQVALGAKDFPKAAAVFRSALERGAKGENRLEALYGEAKALRQMRSPEAIGVIQQLAQEYPQHRYGLEAQLWLSEGATPVPGEEPVLVRWLPNSFPEVTRSPSLVLEAVAAPGTQVSVNGQRLEEREGAVRGAVPLQEGANTLLVEAVGTDGRTERMERRVTLDTGPPPLREVDVRIDDFGSLNASGWTEAGASVTADGKPLVVQEDGRIAGSIMRIDRSTGGSRRIRIEFVARDAAGNESAAIFEDTDVPDKPFTPFTRTLTSDQIVLEWRENDEPDIWGYDVYYTPPGAGSQFRLNDEIVTRDYFQLDTSDVAKVRAEAVGGQTEFYIRAVDLRGNQSQDSDHLRVTLP